MREILTQHAAAHPSMQAQDAIKFCYQAVYGAEHLLTDEARAHAYFEREWDAVHPADVPMWESLSSRYGRVDLAAWKWASLPREWLFRMFYLTASTDSSADQAVLRECFDTVASLAQTGQLPFSYENWCTALEIYEGSGGGAIHHSDCYRAAEHPAYRVVDRQYIDLIPLLQRLSAIPQTKDAATVIAIDGCAAAGKSTLAKQLADLLGAGIIHMDDFFLPLELRTPERLSEAGGNVHYERFAEQVLPKLKNNEAFTYPVFNCSKMQLDGEQTVTEGQWRVVEGSYSHHPKLGDYMDLRVFCHVSPQEQMRRIIARNGERMANMFAERWIPMEEAYFETYAVREHADFRITTE